jgi:hypothetical protein
MPGSIIVVADTIPTGNENAFTQFAQQSSTQIEILAIAREGTPELDSIRRAKLGRVTVLSADSRDIETLVRATAKRPVDVTADGAAPRWSDAGWWLVPILAFFSLRSFRRITGSAMESVE